MKKILFPTDFSEPAANAFRYAQQLAADAGAKVDLIHVYHLPISDASSVPPEYIQEMMDEAEARTKEELQAFQANNPAPASQGECYSHYGLFVSAEIADFAKEGAYDLIVMGTKGERGPLEKFLGSVTTDLMMKAPCPVLAIPSEATYQKVAHIAYATAFEPTDEHAVEDLMELAGSLAAQVHFVHVNVHSDKGGIEDIVMVKDYPFNFTDFSVINNYSVQKGLEEYMSERRIDWVSLFIPHRRLWERLFHSSFSKQMTFHGKVPLLVFHG
jgi:nucleotide-binding universal stress UspA family protein